MKTKLSCVLGASLGMLFFSACLKPNTIVNGNQYVQKKQRSETQWKLVWSDDFSAATLDTSKWSLVPEGKSDWNRHMKASSDLYSMQNGCIVLYGIRNQDTISDVRPFLTGGIFSKDKFAFQYGKIEIRAKLGTAQGAWPAMWMLAATEKHGAYPRNGEIDIMEHLNHDTLVYQTVHSYYTLELKQQDHPPHYATAPIHPDEFNTYGLLWYPDRLVFTVNGAERFTYPRVSGADPSQWPFDQPFYLLIDQQLGGSWVGKVDPAQLPVEMTVDWVRVYQ